MWGKDVDGISFAHSITCAYAETVHWRRNVFLVPSGAVGKEFITELARLIQSYAEASTLESIAIRAAMVMQTLLLQKPHGKATSKEHVRCLERRLSIWKRGTIDELVREGRTIQHRLRQGKRQVSQDGLAQVFSRLMLQGKVKSALRFLSEQSSGSVLDLDAEVDGKSVRTILKEKHPLPQPVNVDALASDLPCTDYTHPVLFDRLTGRTIRSAVLRTEGSAGPSGIDAAGWRRMCTSFHGASNDLCNALASMARRLATNYVDPSALDAFTACRLIPLDKCPGVRPIGVAETMRRIIGKAILSIVGQDVQKAAGSLQLCAGQAAGSEAAVHAMRALFQDTSTDGVLLIDASNAFNRLNRQTALLNIRALCPPLAPVLINTYRCNGLLFVGGEVLLSAEGTTQGDPLAMAFYAIAVTPLLRKVACGLLTTQLLVDYFKGFANGSLYSFSTDRVSAILSMLKNRGW